MRSLSPSLAAALVVASAASVVAGVAGAAGVADPADTLNGPVIRISTEIVQVDVTVTDSKGRHVTDLRPEEFVVLQDGRPQVVSRFSSVRVGLPETAPTVSSATAPNVAAPTAAGPAAPAAAPSALGATREETRTIVFIVDDVGLGAHSFDRTRRALAHMLKGLEPKDRVDIVTTARGASALAPTTDRAANRVALAAVRRRPWTRDELTTLFSTQESFAYLNGLERYDGGSFGDWNARLVVRSLGVVRQTLAGLQELPGRKAVLLLSEGFSDLNSMGSARVHDLHSVLDRLYGDADDLLGAWRRLGDFAARAGVVVYAVDPRGLVSAGLNAEDEVPDAMQTGRLADITRARHVVLFHSQGTLEHLADQTGGLALLNRNAIAGAVDTVVDDLGSYYLIGYTPPEGTFSGAGFHDLKVRVTRPGLKVRTRQGFFAVTDAQVASQLQ